MFTAKKRRGHSCKWPARFEFCRRAHAATPANAAGFGVSELRAIGVEIEKAGDNNRYWLGRLNDDTFVDRLEKKHKIPVVKHSH